MAHEVTIVGHYYINVSVKIIKIAQTGTQNGKGKIMIKTIIIMTTIKTYFYSSFLFREELFEF